MRYFEDDSEEVYEKPSKKPKKVGERRYDILDSTQVKMPCGDVVFRSDYLAHLDLCFRLKGGCFYPTRGIQIEA